MNIPSDKKIACITGTVWTGARNAPRRMLAREGFVRPIWFTTGRSLSDAEYDRISAAEYHLARANSKVLAYMEYGGDHVGIMTDDFEDAAIGSRIGVLVAGFPEIVAQVAGALPQTIIFALKDEGMELSPDLAEAAKNGQLHRIDVDKFALHTWNRVHEEMVRILGLQSA